MERRSVRCDVIQLSGSRAPTAVGRLEARLIPRRPRTQSVTQVIVVTALAVKSVIESLGSTKSTVALVTRSSGRDCGYATTLTSRLRRLRPVGAVADSARKAPVWDPFTRATCSGVPSATMRPPSRPPSGPRSITWSADRTTSRLCSITTMVLPWSTSWCNTSRSLATSWKCRPVVGSSRMYRVRPVPRRDSSLASLTRCASPPLSVVADCPSSMYPSPTCCSVRSLLAIDGKLSSSGSA